MIKQFVILLVTLTCSSLFSQDITDIGGRYKIRFLDNKNLPPVSFVKINVVLASDKTKATIWIQENVLYKIETQKKSGKRKFELIDNTGLYTQRFEEKQIPSKEDEPIERKDELQIKHKLHVKKDDDDEYISKKIFLNYDAFLNGLSDIDANEMTSLGIEESSTGDQFTANYKVSQRVEGINILRTFYIDCEKLILTKIDQYKEGNEEEKTSFNFKDYKKSDEGYLYPSVIPTPFGDAIVKSIKFNTPFDVMDLRKEIEEARQ